MFTSCTTSPENDLNDEQVNKNGWYKSFVKKTGLMSLYIIFLSTLSHPLVMEEIYYYNPFS